MNTLSRWLLALAVGSLAGCASPPDPMDTQMACIQDLECRARLEHRH